jgi:hypothetical protein
LKEWFFFLKNPWCRRNHWRAPAFFIRGPSRGAAMASWSDEPRIDPVVWATALFGVVTAALLVTAF